MANLAPTAANVIDQAGATIIYGRAGATITAPQPVYFDSATGLYKLGQATSLVTAAIKGLALGGASAVSASGQLLAIQSDGDINLGVVLVVGTTYVLSATAGLICPVADLVSTNFVTVLGTAISTSILRMKLNPTGVQVP